MVDEIWKDISEFKGIYQVSNKGRVRSVERKSYTRVYPSVIIREYIRNNNNVQVRLRNGKKQVTRSVAKLVLLTFVGEPPKMAQQAKHKDGNPLNNNLENLEWDVTSAFYLPTNTNAREIFEREAMKCINSYIYKHYNAQLLNWGYCDIDDFKQLCLIAIWNYIDLYDGSYSFYSFCAKKIRWCYLRYAKKNINKEKCKMGFYDMVTDKKPLDHIAELGKEDEYEFG